MPKINIRHIEAFNAVMKEGSVSKGANTLAVSQPAVTKLIQVFEEYCRFRLFNRDTGRLLPTPEALVLFEETSRLADGVSRVEQATQSIRNLERGRVTILGFPGISAHLIPKAVGPLLNGADSRVNMTLLTRSSSGIEAAMAGRLADFALSVLPTEHPALEARPFGRIALICAISVDHPLAAKDVISLNDLNGVPLISLGRDDLSHSVIQAAFIRRGVAMNSRIEAQLSESACAMAAASSGIAIVTALALLSPPDPRLVFRPLSEPVTMMVWFIIARFVPQSMLSINFSTAIRSSLDELGSWPRGNRNG